MPPYTGTSLEITVFCFLCGNFFHVLALYFLGNSFVCLEGSFNKQMGHFEKEEISYLGVFFIFIFILVVIYSQHPTAQQSNTNGDLILTG